MIDDQNFEKAIRTKLVQHESDVPDAMWSGIESRLLKRVPNKVPPLSSYHVVFGRCNRYGCYRYGGFMAISG